MAVGTFLFFVGCLIMLCLMMILLLLFQLQLLLQLLMMPGQCAVAAEVCRVERPRVKGVTNLYNKARCAYQCELNHRPAAPLYATIALPCHALMPLWSSAASFTSPSLSLLYSLAVLCRGRIPRPAQSRVCLSLQIKQVKTYSRFPDYKIPVTQFNIIVDLHT